MAGKIKRIVALVLAAALMFSLVDGRIYRVYAESSSDSIWSGTVDEEDGVITFTYDGSQLYPELNSDASGEASYDDIKYYIYQAASSTSTEDESSDESISEEEETTEAWTYVVEIDGYTCLGYVSDENNEISINAGTYYVRAISEEGKYDSFVDEGDLCEYKIAKASYDSNSVDLSIDESWEYNDDEEHNPSISSTIDTTNGVTYTYYTKDDDGNYEEVELGEDKEVPEDAGTYYVGVTIAETTNHKEYTTENYVEFTIEVAKNSINDLYIKDWTYGAYDAEENSPSCKADFGEVNYLYFTYTTVDDEKYYSPYNGSGECPKDADAGENYSVKAYVKDDPNGNYEGCSAYYDFKIEQASYDSESVDLSIDKSWTYNDGEEHNPSISSTIDTTNGVTYTYYIKDDDGNYEEVELGEDKEVPEDAGTYYVGVTIAETTNYEKYITVDNYVSFTISKATADGNIISVTYDENTTTTFTYNGSAQYPEATVSGSESGNCTSSVVYYKEDGITELSSAPKAAGTYWIETTLSSKNYEDVSARVEYTINPSTLTASNVSISLNSKDYPVVTVTGVNSKTLTENTDYTCTIKDNTADKSYTITVKGIGNYNGSVSIVKDKPTYTVTRTYEYYKSDGKTLYSSKTSTVTIGTKYVYGDEVTLTPTATGTKWKLLDSAETITVTGDMTVTFRYKLRQYTVTFKKLSGTTTKKVTVDYGTKFKISTQAKKLKSTALKRKNYIFSNWSVKTSSGTTKKSSSASVTIKGTTTITAKWTNVKTKATNKNKTFRISSLSTTSSGIKLKVNKTSGMDGYKIEVSRSSSFKSIIKTEYEKRTSSGKLSSTHTIGKNKLKDTYIYYIRVTAYYKDSKGNRVYGTTKVPYKAMVYFAK